ncbi:MAG: Fe-S cluster assembly protein SufD [Gemmatimonadaceae bacterium]|nr:Fe-S cluster assembly protein SufD [Gemmatimonadaceae bacterium]
MTESSPFAAYRADYEAQASAPEWLDALRSAGIAQFEKAGFPTMKDEDWHFTSVAPIAASTFHIAGEAPTVRPADIKRFTFAHPDWHTIVFVNGRYSADLSSFAGEDSGIRVGSLAEAIRTGKGRPERHVSRIAPPAENSFTALNAAFIGDGAFIEVPADISVKKTIHLVFVSAGADVVSHPRNVIVAARHSYCSIVESYVSLDESKYFTNAVTEVHVGEGARVDHYKLQRESSLAFHVGTIQVRQAATSKFNSFSFATGAALSRTNIYTTLDGEAAECTLNGLYLADGTQLVDHQTRIEHVQPNCPSREVYKGILDGRSHGVFNGKVYVHPEAQKTDGKQSNNNLLLSKTARVDTKPQLEIFADDVKCTHGATIGRLDDNAMFYLNSRGVGREKARMLLTYAFAADVLERIELEPLKRKLEEMVLARFADKTAG